MTILTAQECKLIEKFKRNVSKQYPNAHLHLMSNGYYTIVQEQEDLSVKDILAEYCLLPTKDPLTAWQLAQTSSKARQNINRTHPLKIEASDIAAKLERIESRRLKGSISKEHTKTYDLDIYY
jgi:hypothetical protein